MKASSLGMSGAIGPPASLELRRAADALLTSAAAQTVVEVQRAIALDPSARCEMEVEWDDDPRDGPTRLGDLVIAVADSALCPHVRLEARVRAVDDSIQLVYLWEMRIEYPQEDRRCIEYPAHKGPWADWVKELLSRHSAELMGASSVKGSDA